ncbi:uroporphyrinogen decarboxylase family protein [Slackia heliotrinireducens]|uniref:uroporphyrinogen decarboxylase family protein n=1 Tax=Slackia heliotrinireducens TaxID=84110 RepID=UPI003D9EAC25
MQVRKDEMTSNERMAAYFDGEEVDRLPAMPMVDSFGPKLAGYEMRYKRLSAEYQVEVQKACYDLLGLDGLSIEYGLHGICQACGTVLNDPPDRTPSIDRYALESIEQVDRLDLDCVLRKNDPWIDMCMTACETSRIESIRPADTSSRPGATFLSIHLWRTWWRSWMPCASTVRSVSARREALSKPPCPHASNETGSVPNEGTGPV